MIDITPAGRLYKDNYLQTHGVPETEEAFKQTQRISIPILSYLDYDGPQDENKEWWGHDPEGMGFHGFHNSDRGALRRLFETGYIEIVK